MWLGIIYSIKTTMIQRSLYLIWSGPLELAENIWLLGLHGVKSMVRTDPRSSLINRIKLYAKQTISPSKIQID